jgi:lipid-binding SYLF domain-containing protein
MRIPAFFRSAAATVLLITATTAAHAGLRQDARLINATEVLEELIKVPDQNVPAYLLDRAYGIAVVPDVIKAGFIAAGRRGKGVLVVRQKDGSWSNPVFINLTGGSFGFQAGVQSADVLLVFATPSSVEGIVGGKITLGADAAVAAGPVGRQTSAATDIGLNAQVYSYSRARGLFAGVALDGSALTIDRTSNEEFYSKPGILASDILAAGTLAPQPADRFITAIQRSVSNAAAVAAKNAAVRAAEDAEDGAPAPVATQTAPTQNPERTEAAKTYPMEDPAAGTEPPR